MNYTYVLIWRLRFTLYFEIIGIINLRLLKSNNATDTTMVDTVACVLLNNNSKLITDLYSLIYLLNIKRIITGNMCVTLRANQLKYIFIWNNYCVANWSVGMLWDQYILYSFIILIYHVVLKQCYYF